MSEKVLKGPKLDYVVNSSLGEFYFDCAQRFGDRICQTEASMDKSETYSSVNQRSIRVALEMQKRGVTSKDVIISCTKVHLDNVVPIIATFYLGAKIANLDPILSSRQTTHLLSLVSPKMIFVEEASVNLIEESLKNSNINAEIVVYGSSEYHSQFSDFLKPHPKEKEFKPVKVDLDDIAVIFFSSGTTGLPKAICHSHYSFLSFSHAFYQGGCKFDSVLSFTSFYWISALLLLTNTFKAGGRRIFSLIVDAELIFQCVQKYKVTCLFLAPILTYKLTSFEKKHEYDTSSLYTLITGGTPISPVQFRRLNDTFPHSHVILAYGLSEVGLATFFSPKTDYQLIKSKVGSCGKPASGVIIKIVDLDTGACLGPNKKGEVYIKSPGVMKGYYKMDNSSVFDKDGFLKTGDIAYYDEDQCFFVIERLKEMFKYMSWHVVPSSIEAVLLEHPAIKEVVVFGIPQNEEIGEIPAACVVLKENCRVGKEELEQFAAERVADYEKLRGGVIFVESLMKTPSGKLMRQQIKKKMLNL